MAENAQSLICIKKMYMFWFILSSFYTNASHHGTILIPKRTARPHC